MEPNNNTALEQATKLIESWKKKLEAIKKEKLEAIEEKLKKNSRNSYSFGESSQEYVFVEKHDKDDFLSGYGYYPSKDGKEFEGEELFRGIKIKSQEANKGVAEYYSYYDEGKEKFRVSSLKDVARTFSLVDENGTVTRKIFTNKDSQITSIEKYYQDEKHGFCQSFDENNELEESEFFINGKSKFTEKKVKYKDGKQGVSKTFIGENDTKIIVTYIDNKFDEAELFNKNNLQIGTVFKDKNNDLCFAEGAEGTGRKIATEFSHKSFVLHKPNGEIRRIAITDAEGKNFFADIDSGELGTKVLFGEATIEDKIIKAQGNCTEIDSSKEIASIAKFTADIENKSASAKKKQKDRQNTPKSAITTIFISKKPKKEEGNFSKIAKAYREKHNSSNTSFKTMELKDETLKEEINKKITEKIKENRVSWWNKFKNFFGSAKEENTLRLIFDSHGSKQSGSSLVNLDSLKEYIEVAKESGFKHLKISIGSCYGLGKTEEELKDFIKGLEGIDISLRVADGSNSVNRISDTKAKKEKAKKEVGNALEELSKYAYHQQIDSQTFEAKNRLNLTNNPPKNSNQL